MLPAGESMNKRLLTIFLMLSATACVWCHQVSAETLPSWISTGTVEASEAGRIVIPAIPGVPKIFLPDIGIAGDFAFERHNLPKTDPRYTSEQPRIRDGQIVFFEPIDPYTNAQFTIDLPENGTANIEEAWIYFNKL